METNRLAPAYALCTTDSSYKERQLVPVYGPLIQGDVMTITGQSVDRRSGKSRSRLLGLDWSPVYIGLRGFPRANPDLDLDVEAT